jgi:uncharacterized Zn finger protein (UPF0148 family)
MGNYTVSAPKGGKRVVTYECVLCRSPLKSPLEEAGQTFPCPTCGANVQTPGATELEQQREVDRRQRAERDEAAKMLAAAARLRENRVSVETQPVKQFVSTGSSSSGSPPTNLSFGLGGGSARSVPISMSGKKIICDRKRGSRLRNYDSYSCIQLLFCCDAFSSIDDACFPDQFRA